MRPRIVSSIRLSGPVERELSTFSETVSPAEAEGALISAAVHVDAAYLDAAPNLRIISTTAVGHDTIDLEQVARRGIVLTNGRGASSDAVADFAFGLIFMLQRQILEILSWTRAGKWGFNEPTYVRGLTGKQLGVVGLGEIGKELIVRARAAKMDVVYYNRRRRADEAAIGATLVTLDELLTTSDVIVALVPLSLATKGMFGIREFKKMKPSAYFINVARGAVVDTDALAVALRDKLISGAAIDVSDPEPLPITHPLFDLGNVIITPHIASKTCESREQRKMVAVKNLAAFFAGDPLLTKVSLPTPRRS